MGYDIGGRNGTVVSVDGHLLANIESFNDNPVKLLRWEIVSEEEVINPELDNLFDDWVDNEWIDAWFCQ